MSHKLAEPQRETTKHERVLFRADILSKEAERTQLSEVKSSTSVKDEHVQDCAIQAWVLRGAGYPVDTVVVPKVVDCRPSYFPCVKTRVIPDSSLL